MKMGEDEMDYAEVIRRRDSKLYNFGLKLKALEAKIKTEAPIVEERIKTGIQTSAKTSAEISAKLKAEYDALKEEYRKLHEWAESDAHDKSKIGAITGDNPTMATEAPKRNPFAVFNNDNPFKLYKENVNFGWDKEKFPTFTDQERLQVFSKKIEIFSGEREDNTYGTQRKQEMKREQQAENFGEN